jgi:predicted TIM-barrel fold metal-dependent hydrolase
MFASNFPVDGLNASYGDLFNVYSEIVADFSEAERSALFGGNAERVYRL